MTTYDLQHSKRRSSDLLVGSWVDGLSDLSVSLTADGFEIAEVSVRTVVGSPQSIAQARDRAWWSHGFIDTQVNGYGGVDYSAADLSVEGITSVVRALRGRGTTRHVPTIITNPQERICRNLELIASACSGDAALAYAIPALHVEGPYISSEDGPRGAHDPQFVREPDIGELREWIAAAGGLLKIVTLAPERSGAIEAIRFLTNEGIVVAIGHTAADEGRIDQAIAAGARHSTHLGNGSHAVIPRLRNYLWHQLAHDELTAGIIPDGFHLPPAVMRSFARVKGLSRIVAVSDAAPVAGTPAGRRRWGSMEIEVHDDGHVSLAGTPFLAGAGHLLDHGVLQLLEHTDFSLHQVIETCTVNAAELIGLPTDELFRRPAVGSVPESLIRFVIRDQQMQVTHAFVGGRTSQTAGASS